MRVCFCENPHVPNVGDPLLLEYWFFITYVLNNEDHLAVMRPSLVKSVREAHAGKMSVLDRKSWQRPRNKGRGKSEMVEIK